jgi:ribosomal protein L9
MKFVDKSIVIKPTNPKNMGKHQVEVSLEDGFSSPNKYKFSVIVYENSN